MSAPLGNKNALGKTTGRQSAYQEKKRAEDLWIIWDGGAHEKFKELCRMGDVKCLCALVNKLFPNTNEEKHSGEFTFNIIDKTGGNHNPLPIQSEQGEGVSSGSVEQSSEVQGSDTSSEIGKNLACP